MNVSIAPMSGDEIIALIVSVTVGCIGWWPWVSALLSVRSLAPNSAATTIGFFGPLCWAALMLFVLLKWAAYDVRDDGTYVFFYLAMWFGWTGAINLLLPYVGLCCRDDLIERRNFAAGLAIAGALTGFTLVFAGGNIGDGPGWWVVVFSGGLATTTLLILWVIGNILSRVEEAITVDRDTGAGWRTFGFFVGGSVILGRAVAGDWQSAAGTLSDFVAKGWPISILWVCAIAVDVLARPSALHPVRHPVLAGVFPALAYVAFGLAAAIWQGPW